MVGISACDGGPVEVTMTRPQAEAVLAHLLRETYTATADDAVECFLIVQIRAALGSPMAADHWMVRRAAMIG